MSLFSGYVLLLFVQIHFIYNSSFPPFKWLPSNCPSFPLLFPNDHTAHFSMLISMRLCRLDLNSFQKFQYAKLFPQLGPIRRQFRILAPLIFPSPLSNPPLQALGRWSNKGADNSIRENIKLESPNLAQLLLFGQKAPNPIHPMRNINILH